MGTSLIRHRSDGRTTLRHRIAADRGIREGLRGSDLIDAPAGQVFDFVADFPRHAEWSGDGLEVTKTTQGPVAVGSVFSTTAKEFRTNVRRAPSRSSRPAARSPGSPRARSDSHAIVSRLPETAVDDAHQERRDRRADLLGEGHELEALEGYPEEPSSGPGQHQGAPGRTHRGLSKDRRYTCARSASSGRGTRVRSNASTSADADRILRPR